MKKLVVNTLLWFVVVVYVLLIINIAEPIGVSSLVEHEQNELQQLLHDLQQPRSQLSVSVASNEAVKPSNVHIPPINKFRP
ncbi:MAG: hypothetical protein OEY38_06085 [Gammaproteobacteria bacterium]|nr:hypothetical protein [Gammaproteobacteria bacterium]